jgi:hypothetical protein
MAKKDAKRLTSAVNSMTVKYGKKSSKADNPKRQWLWFVLLIGLIGAGVLLWFLFGDDLNKYLSAL